MAPFYGCGSTASRLEPPWSDSWAESTLEPPSGFEHGTPGLGIQHLDHWAIAP